MGQFDPPFCGFSKIVFSRERVNLWFLVTFNIIISDIYPENFIEILHVVQKIRRFSSALLAIFAKFSDFLTFNCCKSLMTSAYNKSCQKFFSFNLLWIDYLTTVSNHISIGSVFLEIKRGCSNWPPSPLAIKKKLPSKSPALSSLKKNEKHTICFRTVCPR